VSPATTPLRPPLLAVEGLARRYGTARVFEGVDLSIGPGECVALLGESGVGKSTLLQIVAGLDRADAGRVTIDGTDVSALDDDGRARFRRGALGFVFQAFHVLPHLTVGANVALPLLLLGRSDPAAVATALDAVGLEGFAARLPRTLSGGQLQRVAIARALVHRPRLVLADEPTGNLDPTTAGRVLDLLLAETRGHGAACLIATHSASAAARADRALRLTPDGVVPA
jgi:putative ABC transport system ATP-binding protein